jgi:hypothetical protein
MKFLGTLAFGFSSIAALIAAMLSFGFHLKVEGPMGPAQPGADQQLNQCTTMLSAAEQQVAEYQTRVLSLEQRLRDAALVADQTASRLSAEVAARVRSLTDAQVAAQAAANSSSSMPLIAGLGIGVMMFPAGFLLGRRNRPQEVPMITLEATPTLVMEPPAEPVNALPVYPPRRRPTRTPRTLA